MLKTILLFFPLNYAKYYLAFQSDPCIRRIRFCQRFHGIKSAAYKQAYMVLIIPFIQRKYNAYVPMIN